MYIHTRICICICICISLYIYIHIHMYTYIYIYIHTCIAIFCAQNRDGMSPKSSTAAANELGSSHAYPCPNKFYGRPTVLIRSTSYIGHGHGCESRSQVKMSMSMGCQSTYDQILDGRTRHGKVWCAVCLPCCAVLFLARVHERRSCTRLAALRGLRLVVLVLWSVLILSILTTSN